MMKENGGYVYILGDTTKANIYKIGVTRGNVEKRIKNYRLVIQVRFFYV